MDASLSLFKNTTMAEFNPLLGWRYNPDKIQFENVIAPPYDVISPTAQDQLYQKSPYNCVRLILNKEENTDSERDNRYTRAQQAFQQWQAEQVLIQEKMPAYYLYRQKFIDPSTGQSKNRSAILGRVKLEPFDKGIVIPHERTLKKPREDRRKLLEQTKVNFSPVFGLYEDPAKEITEVMNRVVQQKAILKAVDSDQVEHQMWLISETQTIEKIQKYFRDKKIYIADGHHRYQTALEYGQEQKKLKTDPDRAHDSDYVYMALVEFNDPGLVLFPTHRLIRNLDAAKNLKGQDIPSILSSLEGHFDILEITDISEWQKKVKTNQDLVAFGLLYQNHQYILKLKDWRLAKKIIQENKPDLWYQLDVTMISHLILKNLWGIPESDWESLIAYTHSDQEAVHSAEKKHSQAVFFLKAPRITVLRDMGKVCELLPQKSTYFYPKLASGLVFYQHQS